MAETGSRGWEPKKGRGTRSSLSLNCMVLDHLILSPNPQEKVRISTLRKWILGLKGGVGIMLDLRSIP